MEEKKGNNIDIGKDNHKNEIKKGPEKSESSTNKAKKLFSHALKKLIKKPPSIDKNTVVYQLPGTGDAKFKNYSKITNDIRKVERMIKKENKLKNKQKMGNNEQNKKKMSIDYFNIYDDDDKIGDNVFDIEKYDISQVIKKFKIDPEQRTIEDLYIIKNYLSQTKLAKSYQNEFYNDPKMIDTLITFCGLEFRYKRFNDKDIIFKIGDPSDNFYMILKGKVDLYKTLSKVEELTGHEYFKYLISLKKQNELYRYKLCLHNNIKEFRIHSEDENLLPYIYLHFVFEDINGGKQIKDFKSILDFVEISPKDLGLDEDKVNSTEYIMEKYNVIKKKFPDIPKDKFREYRFINNSIIKREVKLYDYSKFMSFEEMEFFGENSIENNTSRNGTTVCRGDTEVVYLTNKQYINNILVKKAINLEKKTSFLSKNYLFNKIPPKKFEKKYFSLFIYETYHKGDILFKENECLQYVYFIKEGHVKLFSSKSILELEILISELNKKISMVQSIFNNSSSYSSDIINYVYNSIKSDIPDMVDHISKKENIDILILKDNEEVGIESYFLGIDNLATCIVDSLFAKVYKIDKKFLTEIFEKEKSCFFELVHRVENKLKLYSKRLFEINNVKISMTDIKITEEKNATYKTEVNDNLNTSNFWSQTIIGANYGKIKEVISNNSIKNNNHNTNTNNSNDLTLTLPNISKGKHRSSNSRNAYNYYMNLTKSRSKSIKSNKIVNNKNINKYSFNNIDTNEIYVQTNSNKNTNYKTKSSISWNKRKKFKNKFYKIMESITRDPRKAFLYEEQFLFRIKNDMNNLLKQKLVLTKSTTNDNMRKEKVNIEIKNSIKKIVKIETIENTKIEKNENGENITKNISQDNTTKGDNNNDDENMPDNNEIKEEKGKNINKVVTEKKNEEKIEEKKVLITEINNNNSKIKNDIKNSFLKTDHIPKNNISNNLLYNNKHPNKKHLINLKKKLSDDNLIKKELIEQKIFKIEDKNKITNKQRINQNIFNSHMIVNKSKKIEHPYYSPLTLVKQQKYRIFVENDKYFEDKKRYEIKQKNDYKKRGLNEFGYPLYYNKRLIRRNNITNNTEEV